MFFGYLVKGKDLRCKTRFLAFHVLVLVWPTDVFPVGVKRKALKKGTCVGRFRDEACQLAVAMGYRVLNCSRPNFFLRNL